jgi:protein-S-isoprenylcysteine O-methyltransferase Ste14
LATARRNVLVSILFTLFGGPGIILVYLPLAITRFRIPANELAWHEVAWQRWIAAAIIGIGLVPLLESIVRFVHMGRGTLMPQVPTEKLVVSGLYRFVRNPMYVGDLTVLAGEALLFRSYWLLVYALFVWVVLDAFIRKYEEPTLTRRHGSAYDAYTRQVRRWIPRLRSMT